jgi:hypothetical protein
MRCDKEFEGRCPTIVTGRSNRSAILAAKNSPPLSTFRITPSGSLGFHAIVYTIDSKPVSSLCRDDHVPKAFTRTSNQSLSVYDTDSAKDKYLPELAVNAEMRMAPTRVKPLPASPSKRPLARRSDLAALRAASFLAYVDN